MIDLTPKSEIGGLGNSIRSMLMPYSLVTSGHVLSTRYCVETLVILKQGAGACGTTESAGKTNLVRYG